MNNCVALGSPENGPFVMYRCIVSGKIRYTSTSGARKHLRKLQSRPKNFDDRLTIYYCSSCEGFHLGHPLRKLTHY